MFKRSLKFLFAICVCVAVWNSMPHEPKAFLARLGALSNEFQARVERLSGNIQKGTKTGDGSKTGVDGPGGGTGGPGGTGTAGGKTGSPGSTPTSGGSTTGSGAGTLPNPSRTPGATNPRVTQANIRSTICVSGWTSTVRPPSSYTTALKKQQLASGYAVSGDTNPSDYEEDHLISLELGGDPRAESNLWPEHYQATAGAKSKDAVENALHRKVCAVPAQLTLAQAQHAISTDWRHAA